MPDCALNIAPYDNIPRVPTVIDNREDIFIQNLFICDSTLQAALKAGYSESYATGSLYAKIKHPKFQAKIREYAVTHELINSVPKIMHLESKALEYLQDKPDQLPKFASILKQKKQIAGLLSQDAAPAQAMISIGQVSNLMLQVSQVQPGSADNVSDNALLDANML